MADLNVTKNKLLNLPTYNNQVNLSQLQILQLRVPLIKKINTATTQLFLDHRSSVTQ